MTREQIAIKIKVDSIIPLYPLRFFTGLDRDLLFLYYYRDSKIASSADLDSRDMKRGGARQTNVMK